jgi:hypothetical protein
VEIFSVFGHNRDRADDSDGTNTLSYTLWVYEPSNTHKHGDGWNGEDLSIFSYDDVKGDDDLLADHPADLKTLMTLGSRAIESWCRPYPAEVVGTIVSFTFDIASTEFDLTINVPEKEIRQEIVDETIGSTVDAGAVVGGLAAHGEHGSRSSAQQEYLDATRPGWERPEPDYGVAIIYTPFVHYLCSAKEIPQPQDAPEKRLIGRPSPTGEEWVKGDGGARVDLEISSLTKGKVECDGQWLKWTYPVEDAGGELSLKFRKWRE